MRHHLPQKVLHSKGGSHKDILLCTPLLWDTPNCGSARYLFFSARYMLSSARNDHYRARYAVFKRLNP